MPADAGEGGRLADRSAGIGAVAPGHSRAATAGRAAARRAAGATQRRVAARLRHGDTTLPNALVSFDEPIANWSMFSLPSMPAPAPQVLRHGRFIGRREAFQDVARRGGGHALACRTGPSCRSARRPAASSVSPAARAASAALAAASAWSGVSTRKALSGLALATFTTKASATSTAEKLPARTPSRIAAMPRSVRSVIIRSPWER